LAGLDLSYALQRACAGNPRAGESRASVAISPAA
jgi:hypothetical protein